ncbi:DNA repair ATPase [Parafrankia sp. Ea1.12]|uniref:AAA family ATPase n=1 Tax=Parafrankia sp. Ea1.12 TaxID=573499 RepID=UPI000DA4BEF2|nr:AAA family ATPase [Parafrankia sp. Ea1.12]SQD98122.1 DNA repair ATPase [Parafrankia sp. Ea1.12]
MTETEPNEPEPPARSMPEPSVPEQRGTARPPEEEEEEEEPGRSVPIAELAATRLAQPGLAEPVKELLREALGSPDAPGTATTGRVYLDSVTVTGYRGIGARTRLALAPGRGVNLVTGRNGSAKSSIAESIETAFTGTNARWERLDPTRRGAWRNLHDGASPRIEVKLAVDGDNGRSTLTRTWNGDDFGDSQGELKRPGHGKVPEDEAAWARALTDFRPFLSYVDLDRMINGRPVELYDAVNVILGLGDLGTADSRLREEETSLRGAAKRSEAEAKVLKEDLYELPDEGRAIRAIEAFEATGGPDLAALTELLATLPAADDGRLAELRLAAALRGPDPGQVTAAVARLREAAEAVEATRATDGEDALHRAELLADALAHHGRHAGEQACPVCGTGGVLDADWARRAAEQVTVLRREGEAAGNARRRLTSAVQEVRSLIRVPSSVPAELADVWREWGACRTIDDPAALAGRAVEAAQAVATACTDASREAAAELASRDERWRPLYGRLASWTALACEVEENKPRFRNLGKARRWLKELVTELQGQRMEAFGDESQRIWEQLRQESNVSLKKIHLHGSERATVRKLVMDVSVDGAEASALSVMSQGEQHSLALSLFLPLATAADSPFGFVVIDDPVQSMDPAKVNGLARVLDEIGRHRQVVVFTHDPRLQRAFTSQELPVTILQVERAESSRVSVRRVTDPVAQALKDARDLASTKSLPPVVRTHVLPGVCRTALESAFTEAAWIRHHRDGGDERVLQTAIDGSGKLDKVAAIALFGDVARTRDVYGELARLCGGSHAVEIVKQCQRGAHGFGAQISDPHRFVDRVEEIVEKIRRPQVAAP